MSIIETRSHQLSKRDALKARAARRNAARAAGNATAQAVVLSPEEAMRARIRNANLERQDGERKRALRLLAPLREPPPDAFVQGLQARAEGQRRVADSLDSKCRMPGTAGRQARADRKEARKQAKLLDIEAQDARTAQLAAWRRSLEARETETLAKGRGDSLEDHLTETPAWIRDEDGALVRDEYGLPKLNVERATVRRQKNGLDWLRDKGKISDEQHRIGAMAGSIWSDAAQAAEPGRVETGSPSARACKPSPGPADWRLAAMQLATEMEASILSLMASEDGVQIVRTCKAVCYGGQTTQRLAADDRYEQVRAEERLKLGLALIRYWLGCTGALRGENARLTNWAKTPEDVRTVANRA